MTVQAVSSIVRQVLSVIATAFGIVSASTATLHLPVAISAILTACAPVVLAIEHYLSDPSTGTSPTPAGTATSLLAPPPT